ncbi:hypothetical protein ABZ419_24330 [Streptomyces cinnamoneus]|uniref:hypothetical protein n=1 Tax=Streptomyces cinnamoneus TaxID=53446 RepID=UPI0033DBE94E
MYLMWAAGVRAGPADRSGAEATVREAAYVLNGAAAVAGIVRPRPRWGRSPTLCG